MQAARPGATCMQQDTTPEAVGLVFVDGRWLRPVSGGTNEFDEASVEPADGATADEPSESPDLQADSEDQSREPGAFEEGFNPESLPPELRTRYDDMSRDYYGKTQSLAAERREVEALQQLAESHGIPGVQSAVEFFSAFQNPETRAAAFEELADWIGYQLPDDDEDADFESPDEDYGQQQQQPAEFRDPRLDAMLYEAELDSLEQQMAGRVNELAKTRGLSLSDKQRENVMVQAFTRPAHVNGEPDVDGAFDDFMAMRDELLSSYRETKKPPQPPVGGAPGVPDDAKDLGNDKVRRSRALEVANRAFASEV